MGLKMGGKLFEFTIKQAEAFAKQRSVDIMIEQFSGIDAFKNN